jgi:putative heme utilization carrier protein HutX
MPNITDEQIRRVRTALSETPGTPLSSLAEKLQMPEAEVVRALPDDMRISIPVDDFESLWQEMCGWEKVTFITTSPATIIEVAGKLPSGSFGRGFFNLHEKNNPLGGHLKIDQLESIWLISKPLFKIDTLSVNFYTKSGDRMFSIYVGRDEQRKLLEGVKTAFGKLWKRYAPDE